MNKAGRLKCDNVERTKASCCRKFQILDSDNFIDPREGDSDVAYWSTITQATSNDLVADVNKATQAVLILNEKSIKPTDKISFVQE